MSSRSVGDIPSRRIDVGGVALNVRECGDGPLMLFLHGITANSAVFTPLMNDLSDRFRAISVDQRGHGHSDKPDAGYTADDYADDVAGLVRALDRGPAIIVGHSLGARNGVTAAWRYPDFVRSVVAIDFTPFIEPEVFDALDARVNAGDQLFPDEAAVRAYLQARYPKIPAPAIAIRAASGYQTADGGLRPLASPNAMAQTATGLRDDLTAAFSGVTKPVLIVRGALSKLVSPEALAKTSRLRPDLPTLLIDDADHYVNEEAHDPVLKAIEDFVGARMSSAGGAASRAGEPGGRRER